ncbi:MAG: hypothetical protein ACLR8P_15110 [Clostridium fessum]
MSARRFRCGRHPLGLYYTLDREEYGDRPTRYESESERSRRAREAKARLERDRRDEDGFEYIDDPQ